MTCPVSENAVSFIGMKHLDSAFFSGSYGVLRGRVAMVIAAIMFALVFVGGARNPKVPTLFQVADVDTGVINWVNADLVTHICPRV